MHRSVLVFTGPCTAEGLARLTHDELEHRVYQQLEPYWFAEMAGDPDMDYTPYTKSPQWDWYVIGGRFRGLFVPRSGKPLLGCLGVSESMAIGDGRTTDRTRGMVARRQSDVVCAGDIDWPGSRTAALAEIAAWYDDCAARGTLGAQGLPTDVTREEYLAERAERYCPATTAICDGDVWLEWARTEPIGEWAGKWLDYVNAVDPDTLLIVADCHI